MPRQTTTSSGDNTESFNEDVAAQTPVNETEESNGNEDQQLATKEIAKLKKEMKLLKNTFLNGKICQVTKSKIIQKLMD